MQANTNFIKGLHLIGKQENEENRRTAYQYDSYYRLKGVEYDFANNTAARTDSFFADGVHNIEQSTENGVTYAWGVDKLNRLALKLLLARNRSDILRGLSRLNMLRKKQ